MKKIIMYFFLILSSVSLFTACQTEDSADVNQDKIYTVYELFYNSNTDKTVAIAHFRFGTPTGTLLEVNDPAAITFDGDSLPYNILYAGHAKEYEGLVTLGTFEYTNTEGIMYTNSLPTMTIVDFPTDLNTIIKSQANTISWIGDPLNANERVGIYIGSWTLGQDALSLAIGTGTTDVVLGTEVLKSLALGGSTCTMDRVNELTVAEGTSESGLIRTRFRPKNRNVVVVE